MEKFRWCFIGVGGLANRVVKQLLSSDRHEVVSCYRRNQKKNEEWAKKYHSKAYESAKDAILAPGVDAVYVVTPHSNHLEYAKLALSLGKPVLVEKSFTVSEKEAIELFEYAKEKNLYISEAMWTFYSPVGQKVIEWVRSGRLGKITKAEGAFKVPLNKIKRVSNSCLLLSFVALIILSFIDVVPWKQDSLTRVFYSCGAVFVLSLIISVCCVVNGKRQKEEKK